MAPEERDRHEESARQDALSSAPTPGGDTPEELRYEGPITIDDDEDDEYLDENGGSGKVFLTAAVLSALVLVIIATAMWMRNGSGKRVEEQDLAAMEPPPATAEIANRQPAPPATGDVDYRALPDARPGGQDRSIASLPPATPPAAEERAVPPPVPPVNRPRPREARNVEAAGMARPAPAPRQAAPGGPAEIRRQVLAGHVAAAARAGEAWARTRPAGEWTLQVLTACQPDTVRRAFRRVLDPDLVVLPTRIRGRACYRLCWKTFPGEEAARRAVAEAPDYFRRETRPIARPWKDLLR